MTSEKIKFIETTLCELYTNCGIDTPSNHDNIVQFIVDDIEDVADEDFHDGDIRIAFRRYIDSL